MGQTLSSEQLFLLSDVGVLVLALIFLSQGLFITGLQAQASSDRRSSSTGQSAWPHFREQPELVFLREFTQLSPMQNNGLFRSLTCETCVYMVEQGCDGSFNLASLLGDNSCKDAAACTSAQVSTRAQALWGPWFVVWLLISTVPSAGVVALVLVLLARGKPA